MHIKPYHQRFPMFTAIIQQKVDYTLKNIVDIFILMFQCFKDRVHVKHLVLLAL